VGAYNFEVAVGEDIDILATITSGGSPLDLTGYTFAGEVDQADGTAVMTLGVAIEGPAANGQVRITGSTVGAPAGTHEYDVFWLDGTGKRRRFLHGIATFVAAVTDSLP